MVGKPTIEAVAFYAVDPGGRFLCVKRSDEDSNLPGVWGLPAATVREGETSEDAVVRGAHDKLGLRVTVRRYTGDDTQEKADHNLHLREYEIEFPEQAVDLYPLDSTTSHYVAFQWSNDPEVLRDAAEKGSSCSRIFLRNLGLWGQNRDDDPRPGVK